MQVLLAHARHLESQGITVSERRSPSAMTLLAGDTGGWGREATEGPAVGSSLNRRRAQAWVGAGVRACVHRPLLGQGASPRLPAPSVCGQLRRLVRGPPEGAPWREPRWLCAPEPGWTSGRRQVGRCWQDAYTRSQGSAKHDSCSPPPLPRHCIFQGAFLSGTPSSSHGFFC